MIAQTLASFYTSKVDDFDSLPPALEALTVLSKLSTFDDETAVEVYQACVCVQRRSILMRWSRVVENVNMKAYVQATRHLVYTLFDSLIATHRNGELRLSIENPYDLRLLCAKPD